MTSNLINGTDGNDLITGTDGDDVIDAGGGNDTVIAGAGDDVIYQRDAGSDDVDGGDGTDTLVVDFSGETQEYFVGNRGIWSFYYDAQGNYLNRSGAGGYEVVAPDNTARWGINSAHYSVTYSEIEHLDVTGTQYADFLLGGVNADVLRGGAGNDVFVGGGGNDTLEGGEGDDTFQAGNHAQQIDGGAGMDRLIIDLSGFAGDLVWNNDPTQTATLANGVTMTGIEALTLTTGAGNDELRNTMVVASDSLSTGDGDDVIDAGGGNDTVIAGAGDDVIYQRDAGSDDVDGGDGTDTLVVDFSGETQEYFVGNRGIWSFYYDAQGNYLNRSGAGGYEVVAPDNTARWGINSAHYSVTYSEIEHLDVTGTQYADFLLGGVNADVLRGGAGNDVFVGGGGNDTLEGGEGDDTFQAGNHAQQIDGGAGMDRLIIDLSGFAGDLVWNNDPTQTATLANGVTMTGIEALTLTTGAGNDELRNTMVVASDSLSTGDGDDVIDAGGGNDTVIAGAGDDVIYQRDAGSDDVDGGDGTDTLVVDFSGETQEYFVGNRGIWSFYYDAQGNYLNRSGAGGYEVVAPDNTARWGINSAHYSVTYSEIEHLDVTGTQYADFLLGGVNADVLRGGAGNDVFVGGGGNDTLEGGEGDDTFQAGNHAQQIDGGAGMDRLIIDLSGFAGDLVWNNDPTQTATLANGVTMTGIEALTLTTGAGNDELRNTMVVASDSLSTGDGDDVIDAGGGNDTVIAGAGDDVIYQRDAGSDDVDGGDGTDTLVVDFSGETQEYFVGNRGIWSFYYDAQGNYLNRSGAGGYEVVAPDNTARWGINSAHYSVTYSEIEHLDVTGTQYADFLLGGVNADVLRGGAGNDVFVGGGGNDTLEGGEGDDTFQAGNHAQQIDGGAGMDRLIIDLSGFAGDLVWNNDPTQTATLANGVTMTGIEALTLTTGAGNDELRNTMVVASDSLSTGDGDDVIDAGGGNDTVIAGAGDDVIYQRDAGSDDVDGGDGTDTLVVDFSGETQEYFVGNRGIWSFYYDAQGNYLNRSGAGGYEVVAPDNTARWGINSAHYSVTYSEIEHLDVTGTQYADFLLGGVNADVLRGGAGNDVFVGGGGNDTLEGGEGDDTFQAGNHAQQIDGGAGMDRLIIDLSGFAGDLVWNNDPTQTATLANGVTMTGIEALTLTTGAGNDELRNTMVVASDSLSTGDGDDVIDAGGGNDTVIAGAGDDVIYQRDAGSDDVDGGDGTDTLVVDFSGETQEYFVGNRGIWSFYYDAQGNYLNRSGAGGYEVVAPDNTARWGINSAHYSVTYSEIEHLDVTGTQYADFLLGGVNADVLRGGAGNDVFVGGGGNDTLEGGEGDDTANYSTAPGSVFVDLGTSLTFQDGHGSQDVLSSIERVIGGNFDDLFRGGPGSNAFDGGDGFDTVDYSAATGGVVLDLRPGTAFQNGMGGQDTLVSIEKIIGSSNNDVLIGNGDGNVFDPGTGGDALDGGGGTDRLVIDWSTVAVTGPGDGILMDAYDAEGSFTDDPTLAVEWFIRQRVGTANQVSALNFEAFRMTGTAADDVLRGTVLADTLSGSAGDDVLDGNLGADLLAGGDGADTFIGTLAHLDGDSIADLAPDDVIVVSGARFTGDGVVFSDGKLVIDPSGDGTTNVSIALDGSFTGRFEATPSDPNDAASTSIRYIAELPVISIKALDAEKPEGEFGMTPFTFEVTRSGDLSGTSSVDYAVSGWGDNPTDWRDFDGPTIGTVFFAPGEALKSITVDVAEDAHSEFAEGFTVALSTPVAATIASHGAVGTITNRTLLVDAGISGEDLRTVYQLTKSAYGLAALPGGWERLVALPAFGDKAFDPIRNLDPTTRDKGFDSDGFFIGKSQYSDLGGSGDPPKMLVAVHLTLGKIDSIALAAPGGSVYPTYVHGHLYDSVAMLLDAVSSFVESSIDRPDVWVTGHSRGGGQTNEIFEFSNGDGTVFDSARYVGFSSFEVSRSATEKNILHIGYENDPVFREWISDASYARSTRIGTASSTDHFVYFDHGHIWNYWWGPYTRAAHNFSALDRIVDAVTLSDASGYIGIDTVVLVDSYSGTVVDNPGSRNDHLGSSAVILGDYLNDHLVGKDKSDVIFGFSGSDTIDGGGGNDTVDGGLGADVLIGGNGKDIFIGSQATLNGDTISDFSPQDIIRFDGVWFGSGELDYTGGLLFVDSDKSGTFETAIKLDGDFSVGKFVATHSAPSEPLYTFVTYEASDVLVWIVPSAISKYEGDAGSVTEYVYTVIRWGDLEKTSVFQCTITPDGTDGADSDDFEGGVFPLSRELTFQKDQTSQDIRIRVQGDNQKNENDEGFKITLSAIENATIVPDKKEAVGIIQDDDTLPRLSVSDATARESDGEIVFKVTRTGDLDYDSAANWRVELPSPAAYGQASDTDLGKVLQGTVFFPRGSTDPQTIKVAIVDDPDFEPSETFPVILDKPLNAVLTKDTARGTIKDDDGDGEVSITAIDADKDEGTATSAPVTPTEFTFEVSRSGKSQEAFSVKYAVSGSGTHPHTATVPDDFIGLTTDTLHFAENEPSKIVTIHVAPDDRDEEDEGFLVTLSDPTNDFQIGQPDAAFGLIRNDDDLVFSIAPQNASQLEGDKKTTDFTFTVTRGGNVHAGDIECSVDWAVTVGSSGGPWADRTADFDGRIIGTVDFAADGVVTKTIHVPVKGETIPEANEIFDVKLSHPQRQAGGVSASPTIGTDTARGTIMDDDSRKLSIVSAVSKQEGTDTKDPIILTEFNFTVIRSNTEGSLEVPYGVTPGPSRPADGSDVPGLSYHDRLIFGDGIGSAVITVKVQPDNTIESDETFFVALGETEGWTFNNRLAVGTIQDDDAQRVSISGVGRSEGSNGGTTPFKFMVTRSNTKGELDLSYTVTPGPISPVDGSDIAGLGSFPTLHFADGEGKQTIQVNVNRDNDKEPNETFYVTLSDPGTGLTFGNRQAVGTISNDDPVPPWPRPVLRGDPHLVTLDGLACDFQAVGEFVAMQSADGTDVAVQIRTTAVGDLASNITAVAVLIDGHRVTITAGAEATLRVGGVATTVPDDVGVLPIGSGFVEYDGSTYTLTDPGGAGMIVQPVAGRLDLVLTVDPAYAGALYGLLGNFNGDPTDDLALADGTVLAQPVSFADLYGAYADSWRVTEATSLFDYDASESTTTLTDRTFPRQIVTLGMLPEEVVMRATALVDEAGISEPVLRAAAILDLALTGDASYLLGATIPVPVTSVVEIIDAPSPLPILTVVGPDSVHWEGDADNTSVHFEVYRTGSVAGELTVNYQVLPSGDHPADADDFGGTLPSGILEFADGEALKAIDVIIAADTLAEYSEIFAVRLSVDAADRDRVLFAVPSATATIENDDGDLPVRLDIIALRGIAAEGDAGLTTLTFEVIRSGNAAAETLVDYLVMGVGPDPAESDDFGGGVYPTGTLSFLAGETRKSIAIDVRGDRTIEPDKHFVVKLADATNASLGFETATGIILNDDVPPPPDLVISGLDAVKTEGNSDTTAFTFVIRRTGDTSVETSVEYVVTGLGIAPATAIDFGGLFPVGTVVFSANETEKLINIAVSGDTDVEPDEAFAVTLGNVTNGTITTASADGTILNDDHLPPPELAIVARDAVKTEGDSGSTVFTFAVIRSGDTSVETSVEYLVAGFGADPASATDFGGAFPAGSVFFAAGEDEKLISVEVSGDNAVEPDEGFSVTLTNPDNATLAVASAVGMIENDDTLPPPILSIAPVHAQRAEGDTGITAFTFVISRSGDLSTETTVQYGVSGAVTADDFSDGALPLGTIVFAPWIDEQLLTIDVKGDEQIEPHEAFTVSLRDPVNGTIATASAAGAIVNDDSISFRIGDAPARPPRSDPGAWERSWTQDGVSIWHKSHIENDGEPFTNVMFGSSGSAALAGGDVSAGDLGVSGQTLATSPVRQEIDGTEGLRFVLDEEANQITFQLSRFLHDDDGTGLNEAGRLQLLDAEDELVEELFFYADGTDGTKQISLAVAEGFTQAILSAGAQRGEGFVYGGYGNADGNGFGASPFAANGSLHGSEYLVDSVQFVSGSVDMFLV